MSIQNYRKYRTPGIVLLAAVVIVVRSIVGWKLYGWTDILSTLVINGMVALGTLTLAMVALVENRNTIEQMRIDRSKPGYLKLIAHWIDAIKEPLQEDRDELDSAFEGETVRFVWLTSYTDMFIQAPTEENELPERIVHEIEAEYPTLSEDLDRYEQTIKEYQKVRKSLNSKLEEYFREDFPEYFVQHDVQDGLNEYLEDENIGEYTPNGYLEDNLSSFVTCVFVGHSDAANYTEGYWERAPVTPLDVREMGLFNSEFGELMEMLKEIEKLNDKLISGLNEARENIKDEYNIVESEVIELNAGIRSTHI